MLSHGGDQHRWILLVVDTECLEADTTPPALTTTTSGTYVVPSTSNVPLPPSISRPLLTHTMLYRMGNLAHLVDVKASRLEANVPTKISTTVETDLEPIQEEMMGQRELLIAYGLQLNIFTARVEQGENPEGSSTDLTTLKADIVSFNKDWMS